jgi:TP901 family phage tail tape measure protein
MPSLGDLVVNLKAVTTDFDSKMKGAANGLKSFQMEALATAAAIGGAFAYSSKTFMEYDDAIRAVAAVTGTSGTSAFDAMNQKAKELGRTTSFTAVEVANLMTELGRAGFDPSQINDMTGAVLDLSRATGTEAAEAAGIMSATIRQFGLDASDASRVADVLTMTASKTFNTVGQLGEAFSYIGPVMKQLKIPLEDAAAALGILGNVGIQGSAAGTAFKRFALLTSAEAQKLEGIFGVSFKGVNGSIMGLTDTLATLQGAIGGMNDAEAITALNDAFGLLGITGAASLAAAGDGVKDLRDQLLLAQGASEKMAAEMDAGAGGAFRRMQSAVEGLRIEVGRRLAPVFSKLVDSMASAAAIATEYSAILVPMASGLLAAAAAVLAVVAAMKAYAIATRIALALSGPKGWAVLAVGLTVAAGAAMAMAGSETELATEVAKANGKLKDGQAVVKEFGNAAKNAAPGVAELAKAGDGLNQMLERLQTPAQRVANTVEEFKTALAASGKGIVWDGHPLVQAMLEHESGFTSAMKTITDELAILRGEATATGLELQGMLEAGVDPAQVEQLRALYAEREKIKAQEDQLIEQQKNREYWAQREAEQKREADDIVKSLRTPEEVLQDEKKRVQGLVDSGALSKEAADQFVANLKAKDSGTSTGPKYAGAMQRGSEEAFKAILMAPRKSPELEESKKQTILLRKLADREQKIEARRLQKAV